jgi:integrase
MTKRRSRGDGGLRWSETRQRWIAEATIGYTPAGKRIVKTASGKTKTEAKTKLKEILRDHEDGQVVNGRGYTVAMAARDWLTFGLNGRNAHTVEKNRILVETHIIPDLGARKLVEQPALSADDIDVWLAKKATTLSTRTLRELLSILRRCIRRAQARDKVKRNVALLCDCPTGQPGRPSKSLAYEQADAFLTAGENDDSTIGAYCVTSLLTGARTEEARPLGWLHTHLPDRRGEDGDKPKAHIDVFRSVRAGGDTKTRKSRRSLALPLRAERELHRQRARQDALRKAAGDRWQENHLVFASEVGTPLDAANVRRGFRRIAKAAGLNSAEWTPRELRHSFVSLLSDGGLSIEQISRLVGHSSTLVTEEVYRHQIRPVIEEGATEMDRLFPDTAA